jgi:hypothetical protein
MKSFSINLKNVVAIAICLAATMMFTGCEPEDEPDNGTNNPGAVTDFTATAGNAQVSLTWNEPADNGGVEITGYELTMNNWADNEYTKQLSKPEIGIKAAGMVKAGSSEMFSLTFADGTTKEQIKACVEKVKSDGFTQGASESDDDTIYSYSAKNSAGYSVSVIWTDSPSSGGLMVSKK